MIAWQMWMTGQKLETCRLCWAWCLDVIWWGRLGKVVALVSGLVVIIDILGEARIGKLGDWLKERSGDLLRVSLACTNAALPALDATYHLLTSPLASRPRGGWRLVLFLICLGTPPLVVFAAFVVWGRDYALALVLYAGMLVIALLTVLAASYLVPLAAGAPLWVLRFAVAVPAGYMFAHPRFAVAVRTASLFLFLVGAHFDLLAS